MFFTQDDYKKIQDWLTRNSIKDTEFNEAIEPLNGNETIALVQNGHNVKASLKDFISQLFLLGVSDFLNVSERFNEKYISLSQAIALIPFRSRKIGQVITFLDGEGEWKIYQFQGERVNQWNNTTLWIDLIKAISGEGNIVPDEEDITGVEQEDKTVLKFKDKAYNKDDYSGLGRVYLRKNITTVTDYESGCEITTNLLTQNMIGKENTIYIIQYDYNLNGQTIVIPENCVLEFDGGSLRNGTIIFNNSNIISELYYIFININIKGDIKGYFYIDWILNNENIIGLNKDIFKYNLIFSKNKTYVMSEYLSISNINNINIDFNNCVLSFNDKVSGWNFNECNNINITNLKLDTSNSVALHYSTRGISFKKCKNIKIKSCEIYSLSQIENTGRMGIGIIDCKNVNFENIYSHDCIYGWPFYIDSVDTLNIYGCISENCWDGIKLTGIVKNVLIEGNLLKNNIRDGIDFAGHYLNNYTIKNNTILNNGIEGIETKTLDRNLYPLENYNLNKDEIIFNNIFIENNNITNEGNNKTEVITIIDRYSYEKNDKKGSVSISNNVIKSSNSWCIGIVLNICSELNYAHIKNNLLEGIYERAIIVSGGKGIVVSNNTILNSLKGIQISRNSDDDNSILSDIFITENIIVSNTTIVYFTNNINTNDIVCSSCYFFNNKIQTINGPVIDKGEQDAIRYYNNYYYGSLRDNPAADPKFKTVLLNIIVPCALIDNVTNPHCSGWRCTSENPVLFESINNSKPYKQLKQEDKGFYYFDKEDFVFKFFNGDENTAVQLGIVRIQNINVNDIYKKSISGTSLYSLSTDSNNENLPTSNDDGGILINTQRIAFESNENSQFIYQKFFSLKTEKIYERIGRGYGTYIRWSEWKLIYKSMYDYSRPSSSDLTEKDKGYCIFDNNINKPIWWTGTQWVDATGASV